MRRSRVITGIIITAAVGFVLGPVVFLVIAWAMNNWLPLPPSPITEQVAWILAGLSWGLGFFWLFWSHSYLVFVGSGSPVEAFGVALEPTKYLVTTGPYAYVRNPMIVGFLLVLLGAAFFFNLLMAFILFPVVVLIIAVYLRYFEEPHLVHRFGVTYEHYRRHVPMLIPRPTPYVPIQSGE